MKTALLVLSLVSAAFSTLGQGTVNFGNTPTTLISTNAVAIGATAGPTTTNANGFYYALLTAPSNVTSISASAQELLTPTWTFTGLYATNITVLPGRLNGGTNNTPTVTGWPAGQTNAFVVVGWSASLGHDWTVVESQLAGATFGGGLWTGNWSLGFGGPAFFGVSPVGFGEAGGGTMFLPSFGLFGAGPNGQGNPISTGFTLYSVAVPEPSALSLAALAVGVLAAFRVRRRGFQQKEEI